MDDYDTQRETFYEPPESFTKSQKTKIIIQGRGRSSYPAKPIFGRAAGYSNDQLTNNTIGQVMDALQRSGFDVRDRNGVLRRGSTKSSGEENSDKGGTEAQYRQRATVLTKPLNVILYGPPGTGKTYETARRCVEICEGATPREGEVRARYDELVRTGRVVFVTFHQSFGYEEFVEGIRPVSKGGHVRFDVEDGVIRRLARAAVEPTTQQAPSGGTSFSQAWTELRNSGPRQVKTKGGSAYEFRVEEDSIVLTPAPDGRSTTPRSYKKDTAEYIWGLLPKLGDPAHLTPTRLDPHMKAKVKRHSSYAWVIYREMWKLWDAKENGKTPFVRNRKPHVLVIDEINRANISKVMGELITLLEEDKRRGQPNEVTVTLPYSGEPFTLPPNIHILGTMNTADRSIALLDTALRRRFHFEEMPPRPERLRIVEGIDLQRVLQAVNDRLEYLIDRDHLIGHAWLMGAESRREIDSIFRHKIVPLIAEYFYDDWNRVRAVLGGGGHFIARERLDVPPSLGDEVSEGRYRWRIQEEFPDDAYERLIHGGDASE